MQGRNQSHEAAHIGGSDWRGGETGGEGEREGGGRERGGREGEGGERERGEGCRKGGREGVKT